jgi:hypothetical protein
MAYEINNFNGTLLVSVDDQTINTTATDLRLVGRNYSGYGEIHNENFLHLLQNFSNSAAPPRAVSGQIWYDSSSKRLKFFDGVRFKIAGGAEVSATAPAGLAEGDFWYDTVEQQVYAWTGDEFILVGPEKAPVYGETSTAPALVLDTLSSEQQIIKFQVNGEVLAILARTNFTLNPVVNPITGFNELKPGINFINSNSTTGVTSSAHRLWGTAANSDRLAGLSSSEYLRSSNTLFTTQAKFNDPGFLVGDQGDLKVSVIGGNQPVIESTLGKSFIFRISNNGIEVKDIAEVNTTGIIPGLTEVYNLGSSGARWNEIYAKTVRANTFYGTFVGQIESTNNTAPLNFNSVGITGDFNQSGENKNFIVNLTGTGTVTIVSTNPGTINNIDIGNVTARSGKFTDLIATNDVRFTKNAASTLPTNGTLVVTGGVGIGGELNVQGNSRFFGTGGLSIPVGTDAQRPTGIQGMIRFNTDVGEWEGFDGSEWRLLAVLADEDYGLVTGEEDVFVDYGTIF